MELSENTKFRREKEIVNKKANVFCLREGFFDLSRFFFCTPPIMPCSATGRPMPAALDLKIWQRRSEATKELFRQPIDIVAVRVARGSGEGLTVMVERKIHMLQYRIPMSALCPGKDVETD